MGFGGFSAKGDPEDSEKYIGIEEDMGAMRSLLGLFEILRTF